jgi:hypothetical protein
MFFCMKVSGQFLVTVWLYINRSMICMAVNKIALFTSPCYAGSIRWPLGDFLLDVVHAVSGPCRVRRHDVAPSPLLQTKVHSAVPRLGLCNPIRDHPHSKSYARSNAVEFAGVLDSRIRIGRRTVRLLSTRFLVSSYGKRQTKLNVDYPPDDVNVLVAAHMREFLYMMTNPRAGFSAFGAPTWLCSCTAQASTGCSAPPFVQSSSGSQSL